MPPLRPESRLPPEDLLERDEHPLRELAWLLGASLAALAVVVFLAGLAARGVAPRVPFVHELALAERLFDDLELPASADARGARAACRSAGPGRMCSRLARGECRPAPAVET